MTEIMFWGNMYITKYVGFFLSLLSTMDNFYNFIVIFQRLNNTSISSGVILY